jgi:alanine dehydrogenase
MRIGIIREGRIPPDKRVPFTPEQCYIINHNFHNLEVVVQPSLVRCYSDREYEDRGIQMQENMSDCDVLMGIKEVPVNDLLLGKTYFFFSHTIKKQPHNQELLREIIRKKIQLIDYETLNDTSGNRLIGFGRFAGLVGACNGLRAYGLRHGLFSLRPAWSCGSLAELKKELHALRLPGIKIVVTGTGRAGSGAMELLEESGIRKISVPEYLFTPLPDHPVVVQLDPDEYNLHREGVPFRMEHFIQHPGEYVSNFSRFLRCTDLLISAAFWDPRAPLLFTTEEIRAPDFRIKVIADITCDINGSVPTTRRVSTIEEPFFDYNPDTGLEESAFSGAKNITVMAVDNLPCEVPRDASMHFGNALIEKIIPALDGHDPGGILDRATIARNGKLTGRYAYLQDFLDNYA